MDWIATAVEALLWLYNWLVYTIKNLLETTVFSEHPELAQKYADATTILVSMTAIYLILTLFEGLKRFLKLVIIIGWGLLILALALGGISGKL
mgnify:CR=1 FL=1